MAIVVSAQAGASAIKAMDQSRLMIPSAIPHQAKAPNEEYGEMGEEEYEDYAKPRPTGKEVSEAARRLGIDLVFDSDLLYIAEDLLMSDLPPGWESHQDAQNRTYYHHGESSTTQWSHPMEEYYRGLVFMRKEGEMLLEEKATESPPTPEETREMAKYFGVDPKVEVELMDVAKAAVNAPLPPEWEEYEDDDGEVYFYNKLTTKTSEHHPLDGYFVELVRQRRAELEEKGRFSGYSLADYDLFDDSFVPMPWMEFLDQKTGSVYYYNFVDNETSHVHPCEVTRSRLREMAVTKVQARMRGVAVRRSNRELVENLAAMGIQRHFRGMRERKVFRAHQTEEEAEAATKIQALFRGKSTRRGIQSDKEEKAAVLLQSMYRGFKARKNRRRFNATMEFRADVLDDETMMAAARLSLPALEEFAAFEKGDPPREPRLATNKNVADFDWKALEGGAGGSGSSSKGGGGGDAGSGGGGAGGGGESRPSSRPGSEGRKPRSSKSIKKKSGGGAKRASTAKSDKSN